MKPSFFTSWPSVLKRTPVSRTLNITGHTRNNTSFIVHYRRKNFTLEVTVVGRLQVGLSKRSGEQPADTLTDLTLMLSDLIAAELLQSISLTESKKLFSLSLDSGSIQVRYEGETGIPRMISLPVHS